LETGHIQITERLRVLRLGEMGQPPARDRFYGAHESGVSFPFGTLETFDLTKSRPQIDHDRIL
jgi:hypothetical protein